MKEFLIYEFKSAKREDHIWF